ncbi:hypothetical protein [Nocardia sp. AG03]|uniref:hypothetical protein n=1 Tax=Nocardia sp. AG03 TaxID=3025312 RepID=UPI0024189C88|nr:hypothetical protein [Nocardia sp. AG03]
MAAYGAGAYRAALISVWIAVAADVIDKVRVLADEVPLAQKHRDDLDRYITNNDVPNLQKFERQLVETAVGLELIGIREKEELERLYRDRHLCAHPAFVSSGEELFSPTAELVRAHLIGAVEALLSHPPVTGRKALAAFERDLVSDSFPQDDRALGAYLRHSYMDHGTEALKRNLVKVVCKATLRPDIPLPQRWRATRSACELQKIAPILFDDQLRAVLNPVQNGLDDDGLLTLVGGLCYVPGTWAALNDGTHGRVEALLRAVTPLALLETHQLYFGQLPPEPLDQMLLDRLPDVCAPRALSGLATSPQILFGQPDPRITDELIRIAANATSYEGGAAVLSLLRSLAATMTDEQIERLLSVAATNDQIRGSVLGNRELNQIRWLGPRSDRAKAAWALYDQPPDDSEQPDGEE